MTKIEAFEILKGIVLDSAYESPDEMIEFLDKQIEVCMNKSAKAKERAAEKAKTEDAIMVATKAAMTDEWQTIEQIMDKVIVEGEDVTRGKVVSRLGKLFRQGVIDKQTDRIERHLVTSYKLA